MVAFAAAAPFIAAVGAGAQLGGALKGGASQGDYKKANYYNLAALREQSGFLKSYDKQTLGYQKYRIHQLANAQGAADSRNTRMHMQQTMDQFGLTPQEMMGSPAPGSSANGGGIPGQTPALGVAPDTDKRAQAAEAAANIATTISERAKDRELQREQIQAQRDIAQIQSETSLGTASIAANASNYGADVGQSPLKDIWHTVKNGAGSAYNATVDFLGQQKEAGRAQLRASEEAKRKAKAKAKQKEEFVPIPENGPRRSNNRFTTHKPAG